MREQEYEFLLTIAQSIKVSSEFDRILQFHRLVLVMNVDKETSDVEVEFIRDIGIRIGLNPLATNQVLA